MKTISVYIPTHNRPEFLKRALDSLLGQSIKEFQVLVCDDGSNSENKLKVYSVIKQYKQMFSDFVFFDLAEPTGACNARNIMINAADGEYITGLDDDDEFLPTRLQTFLECEHSKKYSYLCAGIVVNDGRNNLKTLNVSGEISLDKLLLSNIVGNQVFTKTEYLKYVGGFDRTFPSWQDYDLWVRLTKEIGSGFKLQDCTYMMNIDHEIGRISNSKNVRNGYVRFIDKHKDILNTEQVKSLAVQDLVNSCSDITLDFVINNLNKSTLLPLTKYLISRRCPDLFFFLRKVAERLN